MPLLKYRCDKCGHIFDELVSSNSAQPVCPECASPKTERAYVGKCYFGKPAGSSSGGCQGSCASCAGCH
ncbi:zinc ribbon domain-containing protein [Clostridia bacterium OttesenSCG-928-F22]|nr:zinc ribbon domain-containing protein [Clostridia bacterium OttesenSCG-928-F22]